MPDNTGSMIGTSTGLSHQWLEQLHRVVRTLMVKHFTEAHQIRYSLNSRSLQLELNNRLPTTDPRIR
jgi:hypothetical protein